MQINDDLVLLDTHVLLWSILREEELKSDIKQIISFAQENANLILSSISLWEIAMLQFKKRIHIYASVKDFLSSIKDIQGMSIQDITTDIAAESVLLSDFHGDPADRLIAATAKIRGATLLTRDEKILNWAELGHIKAIKA